MRTRLAFILGGLAIGVLHLAIAQGANISLPKTVEAGATFSIQSAGSGKATLYIIGPGQVLKREVQLGTPTVFPAGALYNVGRYTAVLASDASSESNLFDVVPASKPADVIFLAKPSRLPVSIHDAITGAVYVFDAYHNLITSPNHVAFELSTPSGNVQKREVETREGAAWTDLDSTSQQGIDKFVVRVGDVSSERIVGQVPGDPCGLKISARPLGEKIQLTTDPVRDCNGNAVPDGTIVTFTEAYKGGQSTVDVPLKRGVAEVQMAAVNGATISVASGVVLGNQIRWEK
jgi:hypothetical protein